MSGNDFPFDVISDEEYAREQAIHQPFTDAVRRLIGAGIRTGVDPATIADARAAIDAVTEKLQVVQHTSTTTLRHEGPPGWVHGGICALMLDQILG